MGFAILPRDPAEHDRLPRQRPQVAQALGLDPRFNPLCNGAGFATITEEGEKRPLQASFNPLCNGAGFATSAAEWRLRPLVGLPFQSPV